MTDLTGVPWRTGRTLGRTLYVRTGGDDWKADTDFGWLPSTELADEAVASHNAVLDLTWLTEAGFGVTLDRRQGGRWRVTLQPAPDGWTAVCGQGATAGEALAKARQWAEGRA